MQIRETCGLVKDEISKMENFFLLMEDVYGSWNNIKALVKIPDSDAIHLSDQSLRGIVGFSSLKVVIQSSIEYNFERCL